MSLSALARASDVAKSTLSEIERGNGNPSLDTLWALVQALDIPFAALFEVNETPEPVQVVRGRDSRVVASAAGVFVSRHILSRYDSGDFELYWMHLEENRGRRGVRAHSPGATEHVFVAQGRARVGPETEDVLLEQGDLVTFPADRTHRYEAVDGAAHLLVIHEYPPRPSVE